MKSIVLFGAGKSSSVLIEYLKSASPGYGWQVWVADASLEAAAQKTGDHPCVKPVQTDVCNDDQRTQLIQQATVVISLLPPSLHILVAKDCVQYSKHLLTASYVDDSIRLLEKDIRQKGLLFLCEMGLDPGIDHMSAMQMIHSIQKEGGIITSFKSHCGGLLAPESDDNPWHYKISWNPRNIIMAGKAGALYKENGTEVVKAYEELFTISNTVVIPGLGSYAWYPNRDSLSYAALYGLEKADTFIRTTLRHPDFMIGWKNLIELKFTDENILYNTDNLSLADFFQAHYNKVNFEEWMYESLEKGVEFARKVKDEILRIQEEELKARTSNRPLVTDFLMVNPEGDLVSVNIHTEREKIALLAEFLSHKASLSLQQLFYLGLEDKYIFINKGKCTVAEVLQFILEKKLKLLPLDKDMVVMLHEIEYTLHNEPLKKSSCLIVKGESNTQTAMAKTVGLPLGIAAKLLLEGSLTETGLHIPIIPSIYEPVLKELAQHGIVFTEG